MTDALVTIEGGQLRGQDLGGVLAFKGVRYARPPVGELRFMPPVPEPAWEGVRDATALGLSCPQPERRPEGWTAEAAEGEDCLVLNVWTPATDDGKRPVMVWFHGGGYGIGSGSWPIYDGARLAPRGDVVVVTVNHRLGPLGYLHLAEYGGPELASSGNAGMLDLVESLRWVRDNIGAFGGDPDNVMIFGESGGGAKVCTLLAMPDARGLFHRAAIQSGPGRHVLSQEQASKAAAGLLDKLGIERGPGAVEALRALPAKELASAGGGMGTPGGAGRAGFAPVLDPATIPVHPVHAIRDGQAPDVPLMIGTTFDEATLFLAGEPALRDPSLLKEEDLDARLALYGERAGALHEAYRRSRPDAKPIDLLLAIQTDAMMRVPSIKLAERKIDGVGEAPVYMYIFCYAMGPMRAGHGFEIPFHFDNVYEPIMHSSPNRKLLADEMSEAWIAFARSGDPNHDKLPSWPAYDKERRATMLFDRGGSRLEDDPWGDERRAWAK
jgi:para-nitrobenzyl esterase